MLYETELLSSPVIAELGARSDSLGLVFTGATEQHGPHLPVSVDSAMARAMQLEIPKRLEDTVLSTPLINVAPSDMHIRFSGTISVPDAVFKAVVEAHLESLYNCGVRRLAVLDFNAPNMAVSQAAVDDFRSRHPDAKVECQADLDWLMGCLGRGLDPDAEATPDHAGRIETSVALAYYGADAVADFSDVKGFVDFERPGWWGELETKGIDYLAANGVIGVPAGANAEEGRVLISNMADDYAGWLAGHLSARISTESGS